MTASSISLGADAASSPARSDAASHGFLLQAGVFTPINFPLATGTTAFGINDTGEITGYYTDAAGSTHGSFTPVGRSARWMLQAPAAPS